MKIIKLNKNRESMVDDADFDMLINFKLLICRALMREHNELKK